VVQRLGTVAADTTAEAGGKRDGRVMTADNVTCMQCGQAKAQVHALCMGPVGERGGGGDGSGCLGLVVVVTLALGMKCSAAMRCDENFEFGTLFSCACMCG
jgi:threonine dehydrogenase-like Zn-dependent dehydrogenase